MPRCGGEALRCRCLVRADTMGDLLAHNRGGLRRRAQHHMTEIHIDAPLHPAAPLRWHAGPAPSAVRHSVPPELHCQTYKNRPLCTPVSSGLSDISLSRSKDARMSASHSVTSGTTDWSCSDFMPTTLSLREAIPTGAWRARGAPGRDHGVRRAVPAGFHRTWRFGSAPHLLHPIPCALLVSARDCVSERSDNFLRRTSDPHLARTRVLGTSPPPSWRHHLRSSRRNGSTKSTRDVSHAGVWILLREARVAAPAPTSPPRLYGRTSVPGREGGSGSGGGYRSRVGSTPFSSQGAEGARAMRGCAHRRTQDVWWGEGVRQRGCV